MSGLYISERVVKYLEDPNHSNALAKIKRISDQAKNKSSKNLTYINRYKLDEKTEMNTEYNKHIFKDNDTNTFKRRKHQFATQVTEPNIISQIKKKANLKNLNKLFDSEDEENNTKKGFRNKEKHVNFAINDKNKKENKQNNPLENKRKIKYDNDIDNNINKKRKTSSDDRDTITHRIVRYLDNPSQSEALAEIKRISEQAKNKSSINLIHVTPENIINNNKSKETTDKSINNKFQRRKFQFATTVYKPKQYNLTLVKEIKSYKKEKYEEKESDAPGSEDEESEDSDFNLEENIKKEKEENNKEKNRIVDRYKKIEPIKEREKYSSNTINVSELNNKRKKEFVRRVSYRYDTISEEYKKRNNLTVEKINNKEKIIKNEYLNKTKPKKFLKTYKTEYFWDKIINRLIEKRIYTDEPESSKPVNKNNKYSNNTFNPFSKYKKDFETNENNITQEKIELDEKEKGNNNVEDNIVYKKNVQSRKYKYMPYLYNTHTYNVVKNVKNNDINDNTDKKSEYSNETEKPNYRIYQKRQIIPSKAGKKEGNPQKNRTMFSKIEKNISSRQPFNPYIKSEKIKKNSELNFKKIIHQNSSNNNNTKKKNIRLKMFPENNTLFQEDEQETNKNNIYSKYIKKEKNKITYNNRTNKPNNNSELIEDLESIEQYSVNTYLKNDLLKIYDTINEEFKDFRKDVFNINLNEVETKMGDFDKKEEKKAFIKKNNKYNVKDLCKGKTTTDDVYRKYKKRAIKIERGNYNN